VAISHISHAATFNVSVAPPDRPEWLSKEARAEGGRQYAQKVHDRVSAVEVAKSISVAGVTNVVIVEYDSETNVGGVWRRRRNALVSVVHKGFEYALQWSAERDYEEEVRSIVASFQLADSKTA
jgi:hypothetical protein